MTDRKLTNVAASVRQRLLNRAKAEGRVFQEQAARKAKPLIRDPHRLRTNAYRVLLTRGREGLVLFVPPAPAAKMDATFRALLAAGAEPARGRAEQAA